MKQIVAAALRAAIAPHVGKAASPEICHAIKREFVKIMRDKFAVNWQRHAKRIRVHFRPDGKPDIQIPEELLETTLH